MRLVTLVLATALSAAACGDDRTVVPTDADTTSTTTTSAPPPDSDPLVGCPSGPTFPLSAIDSVEPLAGRGRTKVIAAADDFLANQEGQHWPQDDWQILYELDGVVGLVHLDGSHLSFMSIGNDDGEWHWSGSSAPNDCELVFRLPAGLGVVDWEVDTSAGPPGRADTSVTLLAHERACASAQPMGDRFNEPQVTLSPTKVVIVLSVTPSPGAQECPANPVETVVVELGEPLGNREVVDGLDVGIDLATHLAALLDR